MQQPLLYGKFGTSKVWQSSGKGIDCWLLYKTYASKQKEKEGAGQNILHFKHVKQQRLQGCFRKFMCYPLHSPHLVDV